MTDKYDEAVEYIVQLFRDNHHREFRRCLHDIWDCPAEYSAQGGILFQFVHKEGLQQYGTCGCLTQVAYAGLECQGDEKLREDIMSEPCFQVDMDELDLPDEHSNLATYLEDEYSLRDWLNKFAEYQRRIDKEVRFVDASS